MNGIDDWMRINEKLCVGEYVVFCLKIYSKKYKIIFDINVKN